VAGAALAEFLYDASAERAKVAFETAIRLEPDNPILRFEYAQALVRLGGPGSAAAARNQWAVVAEMTPRDAVETIITSRARRTLEAGSAEIGENAPGGAISKTDDEHP
jgi:predicted Zn-dependent protease